MLAASLDGQRPPLKHRPHEVGNDSRIGTHRRVHTWAIDVKQSNTGCIDARTARRLHQLLSQSLGCTVDTAPGQERMSDLLTLALQRSGFDVTVDLTRRGKEHSAPIPLRQLQQSRGASGIGADDGHRIFTEQMRCGGRCQMNDRIDARQTHADRLQSAQVQFLDAADAAPTPIPAGRAGVLPLLKAIVSDAGDELFPPPHAFDDAAWVVRRFAEVLPIPALARQRLLELDDPLQALEIVQTYLRQHQLAS